MIQEVIENGQMRSLQKFADYAVEYLARHPSCEEVVQLADHITELEKNSMTKPDTLYPLPATFQYYFSGFLGQVIGVGRPGLIH